MFVYLGYLQPAGRADGEDPDLPVQQGADGGGQVGGHPLLHSGLHCDLGSVFDFDLNSVYDG